MVRRSSGSVRSPIARQAVLYARVSSTEQEREGFSIPAQLRLLHEYAREQGFVITEEFIDIETAKQSGRSGFNQLVRCLRRSKTSQPGILVEKTDRLYRNLKDWVTLDDLDPEIHFVKEGTVLSADSRSADKFMHGIRVLMAKNYIDNLSEEVRKGMAEKAAQGIWPTKTPLGYVNSTAADGRKVIVVDPGFAPLVCQVFEWYATGRHSLSAVTRMSRDAGLRHKTGTPVPKATIHRILTNPLYTGDVVWDGHRFPGRHEAIISRELFERVQNVLHGKPGKHRQSKRDFAFAGLLICGHCGCSLTGELKKQRYIYYHCTGYRGKCGEPYVREEVLEEQFANLLGYLTIEPAVLDWLVDALQTSDAEASRIHQGAIDRLQVEYDKLQRRVDAMYVDKLDGRIDRATFDRLSAEWHAEQEKLRQSIDTHRSSGEVYFVEGAKLLELASRSQELFAKQPAEEKRKLLAFLLSNCTWSHGELTPTFRQPFDLLVNMRKSAGKSDKVIAANGTRGAGFENWYPQRDSNPRSPP
ncbi:MAG: recombinase family protein [Chloroflexia bacterium]|nr:recombinase family protein [Chloroflexia bacterium]